MLLLVALIILWSNTILILLYLQIKGKKHFFLGGFVISSAIIVLEIELLSIFKSINTTSLFLVNMLILAVLVVAFFIYRPPLHNPYKNLLDLIKMVFVRQWELIIFTEIILIGFFLFGIVNWFFWIQEFDSITYHLPRILYWMQHQSLLPWEESILIHRVAFPINAELIELWVTIFWRTDQLIPFVPWVAGLTSILAVYGLSTQLRFSKQSSFFISLVFASIPVVAWQTKLILSHDINTCLYIIICLYFLYSWNNSNNFQELSIAGASFGLALGTKLTAFFILPGIGALFFIFLSKKYQKDELKTYIVAMTFFGMPTLILGSYTYIQNLLYFNNILGDTSTGIISTYRTMEFSNTNNTLGITKCFILNTFRNTYYLFFAGKSQFQLSLGNLLSQIFSNTQIESNFCTGKIPFSFIPTYLPIERSFGLQTPFFVLPGMLYAIHHSIKTRKYEVLTLVLLAISYLLFHSLTIIWQPVSRRFYITFLAIALPASIPLFEVLTSWKFMKSFLVILSISVYMVSNFIYEFNQINREILIKSPQQKYNNEMKQKSLPAIIYFSDLLIPENSRVGIIFSREWGLSEYPLWGKNISRELERGICGKEYGSEIISSEIPFILVGVECESWLLTDIKKEALKYHLMVKVGTASLYKHENANLTSYQISNPDVFPVEFPIVKIKYVEKTNKPLIYIEPIINQGNYINGLYSEHQNRNLAKLTEITRISPENYLHFVLYSVESFGSLPVIVILSNTNFDINTTYELLVLDQNYKVIQKSVSILPIGKSEMIFNSALNKGKNHILLTITTENLRKWPSVKSVEFIVGQ